MPNDLSHIPDSPPPLTGRMAARTARYCARAAALADAPDLTVGAAAHALGHLAELHSGIAQDRVRACAGLNRDLARRARPFRACENDLARARFLLTEALLQARPEPGDGFGRIPHGAAGTVAEAGDVPVNTGQVHAISACRALLDLEALRPFIGDDALRQAIAQHARATRRHDVQGVAYAVLPAGAHLPCAVV